MSSLNTVQLIGRVGKPIELRSTGNGASVANFSIATSESYKDKTTGEKKENTEWHNIVAWRGTADFLNKYVGKGDLLYVEGKLTTRSYEKDGVTKYLTEVVANDVKILSSNNKKESSATQEQQAPSSQTNASDDLPF